MTIKTSGRLAIALAATLAICACSDPNKLKIRRTRDNQELNTYRLRSLTGIRDGENLACTLVLGDNDGSLTMIMRFKVGVPTTLVSGKYTWVRKDFREALEGEVKATSVTFQGGQDSPPSLGGNFELVGKNVEDVSLYDVKVPATRLDAPDRMPMPSSIPAPSASPAPAKTP